MKRLFDFVYGNFMTVFDRVVVNLRELSPLFQLALALVAVALIFAAVMLMVYIIRISKYRTIKKIENVDVVFFNTVYEFGPYKRAKEGEMLFILLIPFTFIINFVIKIFMFKSFSAINASDYITRRMLENMQLENMRMKDKNKELLMRIDEAGLNKKQRKQTKPAARPVKQDPPKEEVKKEEPKVVAPKEEAPKKEEPKVEEKKVVAPKKEEPKVEEVKKEEPKKAAPKQEEPKKEAKAPVNEEVVTTSTIVKEEDKEPEVILAANKVEEPVMPEREILEAEVIDPDKEKFDELIEDVATKETRGKA